ncbi:hypothetical protein ACFO5K_04600 [Nocardia halotolerans]|uniref:Uncharacterized protein n=1 Tax=Nocardia halotolerans TaxID=1755878 RepID=A0ABV8VF69_9NOCA
MHFYQYLHGGRIVESEVPRPDLLGWAYWSEIPAPVSVDVEPEPAPVPSKPAPRKAPAKTVPKKAAS